jgi:hypothetical protein
MTDPQNATLEGLDMPAGKTVQFNGTSARGDVPPAGSGHPPGSHRGWLTKGRAGAAGFN